MGGVYTTSKSPLQEEVLSFKSVSGIALKASEFCLFQRLQLLVKLQLSAVVQLAHFKKMGFCCTLQVLVNYQSCSC